MYNKLGMVIITLIFAFVLCGAASAATLKTNHSAATVKNTVGNSA